MAIIPYRAGETQVPPAAVCIIGAGAAGLTLACELDGSPFSVLVVEAGGMAIDASLARDFTGTANPPHPEPSRYRRFAFGGTTKVWGGRCVPFDPLDFEPRPHVPNSGWPIAYSAVAKYYPRAMAYCDAGDFDFTIRGSMVDSRPTIAGLPEGSAVVDAIERYSLPTDFGVRYLKLIRNSKNISTLLNARCVALVRQPGTDVVNSIQIVDRTGQRATIRADIFVVAVGGIETPRLLFASDSEGPGLGNATDRLGRFYTCHFEAVCAKLVPNQADVRFDFEKTRDGIYSRRKLHFTAETQRSQRLLNTAFRLHFPSYADAAHGSSVLSAIYLVKSALIPEHAELLCNRVAPEEQSRILSHLRNVAFGLPEVAKFGYDWLIRRHLARRKLPYTLVRNADGSLPLEVDSEQTPTTSNRIKPCADVDRCGVRRVAVEWRLSSADVDAGCRGLRLLRDHIGLHTSARLEFDEATLSAQLSRSIPIGGHHMGTARMAATAHDGVVNTDCAIFGLPNVFVTGSAVFRTSSHANPTLTAVAMALRLADHLRTLCR